MNEPEISIVMSVYNEEKHLDESINSILNQTFLNFEYILINDASTDGSLSIIEKYRDHDKRITLIDNIANLGLTKSLNLGLRKARGKYIARIDADDIALPRRLEIQHDFLEKNPNVFLVGSGAYNVDENGTVTTTMKPVTDSEDIKKELLDHNCLYHPTIMFKNEGFLYREKFIYAQDYDLYLVLISSGKELANIFEPLVKYRMSPNAISWSMKPKQKYFELKAREFYIQRLRHGMDEYEQFDPHDLNLNPNDEIFLKSEIKAKFKVNEFKEVRMLSTKYFSLHGFFNSIFVYYVLSFTSKNFVNFIRKILFN